MKTSIAVPVIWNQLAENFYLKDSPTAEVRLSELTLLSFGRVQSSEGLPELVPRLIGEHGYLIALQLKAIPFLEQFFGNRKVSSGSYPMGAVSAIDLREEPALLLPNPFDILVLYITQAALDEVAYAHQRPRVEQLAWPFGTFDPVVYHLGKTLVSSLKHPQHASKIFLNHILHALNCHFVYSYGGTRISARQFRGGLSPLQMKRATEFLAAHLDGNISIQQVAEACETSVSHFARAFKTTFRKPPYKWLTKLQLERARDLMTNSNLHLADIAAQSGFAGQSVLNHFFKRIHGVTPGMWRRRTADTAISPFQMVETKANTRSSGRDR
jgi:AraC family transcriptional regulator